MCDQPLADWLAGLVAKQKQGYQASVFSFTACLFTVGLYLKETLALGTLPVSFFMLENKFSNSLWCIF